MKIRLMAVRIVAPLLLGILPSCVQAPDEGSTVLNVKDHEAEVVGDCFDKLVAGPIDEDGNMKRVAFVNGSCQGNSKALNLLVEAESVHVYVDGEGYEASLYIKGKDVLARVGGREVKVASLSDNPADAELSLAAGVKVMLAVKDSSGVYRQWDYGDALTSSARQIRIYL